MTSQQTSPDPGSALFFDVFNFWKLPFITTPDPDVTYSAMGTRASVPGIVVLAFANSIAFFLGLYTLIHDDPYITFNSYLRYQPFSLAFMFFPVVAFFLYCTVQFLCFRAVSSQGNLTAHSYVTALSSSSFIMLYWLTIFILLLTRIRGIDTPILVIGGLYLLVPSVKSLMEIHKLSTGRFWGGFFLAVIGSVPIYILYTLLLSFFIKARDGGVSNWVIAIIFTCAFLITGLIIAYMIEQKRLADISSAPVPVKAPLEEMFKPLWVKLFLFFSWFLVLGFSLAAIIA
jgi:hypothetical protein